MLRIWMGILLSITCLLASGSNLQALSIQPPSPKMKPIKLQNLNIRKIPPGAIKNTSTQSNYRFSIQWVNEFYYLKNSSKEGIFWDVVKNDTGRGRSFIALIYRQQHPKPLPKKYKLREKAHFQYFIQLLDKNGNIVNYFEYIPAHIRFATNFVFGADGNTLYVTGVGGKRLDVFYIEKIPLTKGTEIHGELIARKLLKKDKNSYAFAPIPFGLVLDHNKFVVFGLDFAYTIKTHLYIWEVPFKKDSTKEKFIEKRNLVHIYGEYQWGFRPGENDNMFDYVLNKKYNFDVKKSINGGYYLFIEFSQLYKLDRLYNKVCFDNSNCLTESKKDHSPVFRELVNNNAISKFDKFCHKKKWSFDTNIYTAFLDAGDKEIVGVGHRPTEEKDKHKVVIFALDDKDGKQLWELDLSRVKRLYANTPDEEISAWKIWKKPGTKNEYLVVLNYEDYSSLGAIVMDLKAIKK